MAKLKGGTLQQLAVDNGTDLKTLQGLNSNLNSNTTYSLGEVKLPGATGTAPQLPAPAPMGAQTGLSKVATQGVGPDGKPIYDIFKDGQQLQETDFAKMGVNVADIKEGQAPVGFQSKFSRGFEDATAAGISGEQGSAAVQKYAPPKQNSNASGIVQNDEFLGSLVKSVQDFINPENQGKTLVENYKALQKEAGLDEINEKLISLENVMKGTDESIRNEIMKGGGTATENQVRALVNSRNITFLEEYSTLQRTLESKEKYLNTMVGLEAQDREAANQRFSQGFNMLFNVAEYQQRARQYTRDSSQWVMSQIGADGLYNSTGGDPYTVSLLEEELGMPQGGLIQAAQQAQTARQQAEQEAQLGMEESQLGLDMQRSQLTTEGLRQQQIKKDLSTPIGGTGGSGGGILSTLPTSVQTKLMSMAESFGGTDIVKKYNATVDGINLINGINQDTQNPSDHQTIVYAFAKSLDPESVVREGEYETIKKYSQSTLNKYNKEITNALNGTGFLSKEAIQNIKTTMNNNFASRKPAYDNLRSEKARVIDSVAGRPVSDELLIDYSGGVGQNAAPVDDYVNTYITGLTPAKESSPVGNWFSGLWSWLSK